MSEPNPLTAAALRKLQAEAQKSLTTTLPREHAVPLIEAAIAAHDAGLVALPAEWTTPAPPGPEQPRLSEPA